MKKLIAIALLCASMQVAAVEFDGIKLGETTQLESTPLVLNGAALREIFFFKMYAIGLYLTEKQHTAAAVFADRKAKRIALHVLIGDVDSERFLNGFRKGVKKNHNEAELKALHERMEMLDKLFSSVQKVKRGDVIAFDWLPDLGTSVKLNGVELGRIAGEDFYRALLSIWLGDKPVKKEMKKALLG